MYEERQKKWVFDQVNPLNQCDAQPTGHQKTITATSSQSRAGGAISSLTAKPTAQGQGHNAGMGRWTTYGGQGALMDIDQQKHMSEGRCFLCHKKRHILKDCSKKKNRAEVHAVAVVEEPLAKDTKVEKVKD